MEKKEMSFIEQFEAAGKELENAIKESKDGAMIMIATNGDDETYANIVGKSRSLSAILAYAALKSEGFDEILANAVKAIEIYREKYNKEILWKRW